MNIITYNVNGVRSAMSKDLAGWISRAKPDVLCLQEIKASPDQFDSSPFEKLGYRCYWHPADRKGYSGVAVLTRHEPESITFGCGNNRFDTEGRILLVDFKKFSQVSVYIPSGSMGDIRQDFKMEFLVFFYEWVEKMLKYRPNMIISGDFNICHQAIDIHDPVRNVNTSGFLPEEREWVSDFLELGFTDSFRYMNPKTTKYSWWSFRQRAREKNLGWRIDYHMVSNNLQKNIRKSDMWNNIFHSDHCPVVLDIAI